MFRGAQRSYKKVELIIPALFIAGVLAIILGVVCLIVGKVTGGIPLLFGGLGAVACAQLFELLSEIARHLAAIRSQMEKGVLGLLGR